MSFNWRSLENIHSPPVERSITVAGLGSADILGDVEIADVLKNPGSVGIDPATDFMNMRTGGPS